MVKWTVAFSFAARESLRNGKDFDHLTDLLSEQELDALKVCCAHAIVCCRQNSVISTTGTD